MERKIVEYEPSKFDVIDLASMCLYGLKRKKNREKVKKGEKGQTTLVCINVLDVWFTQSHVLVTTIINHPIIKF